MMRKITPHRIPRTGSATRMRGFTLIELMIGITIGLIVLLGLTVFFSSNSRNQHDLERSIVRMENSRFALDTLTEDLMHAGYYAQHVPPSGVTVQAIVPCPEPLIPPNPDNPWNLGWNAAATRMPPAVQGFVADEDDGTQDCLTGLRDKVDKTEVITVTHAETGDPDPDLRDETETTDLYIQTKGSDANTQTTSCATDPQVIVATGPASNFVLKNAACNTFNNVHRLSQRTYFLSKCNDCTNNDGIPSLKRVERIGGGFVVNTVAEGVEQLQFEYGVDTNNDGQVDEVRAFAGITGAAPYLWSNVVAVRVHMLTRSSLPDPGHDETRRFEMGSITYKLKTDPVETGDPPLLPAGFKRTLLTTTVPLTNVAGRRE